MFAKRKRNLFKGPRGHVRSGSGSAGRGSGEMAIEEVDEAEEGVSPTDERFEER